MQQRLKQVSKKNHQWIVCLKPNPEANLRLICFPFAGCGASFYRPWAELISEDIELHAIRLPGRETRSAEACVQDIEVVVKAIVAELTCYYWQQKLVFFGHSMGAITAFEVSRRLKALYQWEPLLLFVSGHQSPDVTCNDDFHCQTDAILIEELKRLKGCPSVVFEDKELLQLYLPMLRSDYAITENYKYSPGVILNCPIAACLGDKDSEVSIAEIECWQKMSGGTFFSQVFTGNHFYINENLGDLIAFVKNCLAEVQ